MLARVHVDAVRAALHHDVLEGDVLAVDGMDRPHAGLLGVAVLHIDVLAVDELQQRRQPMPLGRSSRPLIAGVAMILPGPTIPIFSASVAVMKPM